MGFFKWFENKDTQTVVSTRTGASKVLTIIAEGGVDESKRWDPLRTSIKYSESWDIMKPYAEKFCGIKGLYFEDGILRYDKHEDFKDDDPTSPEIDIENVECLTVPQFIALFPDLAEPFKKVGELVKKKKAEEAKAAKKDKDEESDEAPVEETKKEDEIDSKLADLIKGLVASIVKEVAKDSDKTNKPDKTAPIEIEPVKVGDKGKSEKKEEPKKAPEKEKPVDDKEKKTGKSEQPEGKKEPEKKEPENKDADKKVPEKETGKADDKTLAPEAKEETAKKEEPKKAPDKEDKPELYVPKNFEFSSKALAGMPSSQYNVFNRCMKKFDKMKKFFEKYPNCLFRQTIVRIANGDEKRCVYLFKDATGIFIEVLYNTELEDSKPNIAITPFTTLDEVQAALKEREAKLAAETDEEKKKVLQKKIYHLDQKLLGKVA